MGLSGPPDVSDVTNNDDIDEIYLRAFGVDLRVSADDAVLQRRIRRWFEPITVGEPAPVAVSVQFRRRQVIVQGETMLNYPSITAWRDAAVHWINHSLLTRTRDTVIHAAGVCWRGRGVLISGPQDAGKSTTAASLLLDGGGYLSDEGIGVSVHGMIPYPKPLSLSAASLRVLGLPTRRAAERHLLPAELGAEVVDGVTPIDVVLLTRYAPDTPPTIQPIDRATAVRHLAAETFHFAQRPVTSLRRIERATRGARCFMLTPGSPQQIVISLDEMLTATPGSLLPAGQIQGGGAAAIR